MHQEYPKWLFHGTKPACKVEDAQAHRELGLGWYESPGEAREGVAVGHEPDLPAVTSPTIGSVSSSDAASGPPPAAPAASDPVSAEAAKAQADAEKAELYATPVAKMLEKLKGASPKTLERVAAYEAENPKGARVSLIKAIAALVGAV